MTILTRKRLEPLLRSQAGACVSLYMPTHLHHPETDQNPIRFKNCLREAARLLSDRYSSNDIRELLDPVAAIPNVKFWHHQAPGLAILRSREVLAEFRVPITVPELVVVADSFHIRPLLRTLSSNERYFVIALRRDRVTVFEGSLASLTPTEIPGLPPDLPAHAKAKGARAALSAHATRPGGGARRVHAAGGGAGSSEAHLASYFRAIDRAVGRALRWDSAPVILAGVKHYVPLYRQVSRLRQLAESSVSGSPDAMTVDELHARTLPVVRELLHSKEERALEKFHRATERHRTSQRLEDIVPNARRGRVRRLFLTRGVRVWGTIESLTGRIHQTAEQQDSHDDDLLDDVAEHVFRHSGEVIALSPGRMPGGAVVAAELR